MPRPKGSKNIPATNMVGMRFDNISIIERMPDYTLPNNRIEILFKCKCDCQQICILSKRIILNKRRKTPISCDSCRNKARWTTDVGKIYNEHYSTYHGSFVNAKVSQKKNKVKRRKIEWTLTNLEAAHLCMGNCFYCDAPSVLPNAMNGIDRFDNNQGYHINNCVSCCRYCNSGKRNFSILEFIQWIKNLNEDFNIITADQLNNIKNKLANIKDLNNEKTHPLQDDLTVIFPQRNKNNRFKIILAIDGKRKQAKFYGYEWRLSNIEAAECLTNNCTYCNKRSSIDTLFNGIDRVDTNVDYFRNNCVPCCINCNGAKMDLAVNDFRNYIIKIKNYLPSLLQKLKL